MERVLSLQFSENDLNEKTFDAFQKLNEYKPESLASIGDLILKNISEFEMNLVPAIGEFSQLLGRNGIRAPCIEDNHAIALAGVMVFIQIVNLAFKD